MKKKNKKLWRISIGLPAHFPQCASIEPSFEAFSRMWEQDFDFHKSNMNNIAYRNRSTHSCIFLLTINTFNLDDDWFVSFVQTQYIRTMVTRFGHIFISFDNIYHSLEIRLQ